MVPPASRQPPGRASQSAALPVRLVGTLYYRRKSERLRGAATRPRLAVPVRLVGTLYYVTAYAELDRYKALV